MSGRPGLGVVIVTYDSGPVVRKAIDAVLGGTQRPEAVVVVDNGSTDTSELDRLEADACPGVVVDRAGENLGFCAGNNRGLRRIAHLPYALVLNPDAIVGERFVEDAIALLEREPRIGAMNPKLVKVDRTTLEPDGRIDCAGIFLRPWGAVYDRGQGEPDDGRYGTGVDDVPALCGAAILARRSALDEVGAGGQVFDESFFMYKEDIDLSLRLRAAGWRVVLDAGAIVHHVRGNDQVDRASTPTWVRRRSVANEWRIWRKGTLPWRTRLPMFGYLVAKTLAVALGR